MKNLTPIYTEVNNCQDCYKCIKVCPVKAIKFEDYSKFLDDFEIEYDYRYLNEFDKILIESSTPTNHDVYIKNFFY